MKVCNGDYWNVSVWDCNICDEFENCEFRKGLNMKEERIFKIAANSFVIITVLLALYFLIF